LKPLKIGFSNKTNDELEGHSVAAFGVVQGSKRYALVAKDGTFGAKCHGLGAWFMLKDDKVKSIAHDETLLENVWRFVYPHIFGKPDPEIMKTPVFHKFSIKTRKISLMVQEYARRQWDIPLKDIHQYGKSGNFGFLSPTLPDPEKRTPHVVVSFEPEVAESLSDFTLQDVAYVWGCSYDKKFDYVNLKRWHFDGSQIRFVGSFERMTPTAPAQNDVLATHDFSLKNR